MFEALLGANELAPYPTPNKSTLEEPAATAPAPETTSTAPKIQQSAHALCLYKEFKDERQYHNGLAD